MRASAVVCVATLASLAGFARAASPDASSWDGFGVGSWVHKKTRTALQDLPDRTSEERRTLVRIGPDAYVFKKESKSAGADWSASEVSEPRVRDATESEAPAEINSKTEELGTEKITVDGKPYECKKRKWSTSDRTTTTWTHATHGVLKFETSATGRGSMTMSVENLAERMKIGSKEVECRRVRLTSKREGGDMTHTSWISGQVPGRNVKSVIEMTKGKVTSEVIAFGAKPLDAK